MDAPTCNSNFATDAGNAAAYYYNLDEELGWTELDSCSGACSAEPYAYFVYTYDTGGRLTSITPSIFSNTQNGVTTTAFSSPTYNALGQVTSANIALDPTSGVPAVALSRTFDKRGRITSETDASSQLQPVYGYSVGYDGNGNVNGFNDTVMGLFAIGNDALHRLSTAAGTIDGQPATVQEVYDDFGNRKVETISVDGGQLQPSPYLNFTSGNNRMDGWSYDASGNLLYDGNNNYLYDAEGRVCAVQQASAGGGIFGYVYGPDGTRLGKGTLTSFSCDLTQNGFALTNMYTVGPSGEQVQEIDGNSNLLHTNAFWEGRLLGTFAGTGYSPSNWTYVFNDWVGTKRVIANYDGSISTFFGSAPFGDLLTNQGSGGDPSEQHFTGKESDIESGLDYFPARYYNSNMGRFMSPDYNGDDDYSSPVPYADLSNPQTLNLYSYAGNNPLTNVDPDGHDCIYFSSAGDPSVKSGDCYSDTDNGIYVNGTINSLAYNSNNSSLGFSYTAYDTGNIGMGVIAGAPAPGSGPQMDEGGISDESGSLLMGVAGGMAADYALGRAFGAIFGKGAGEAASNAARTAPDLTNISSKILNQMGTRGWTKAEIEETVQNGTVHNVINKATGGPATEYVNPASGKFVVIDNATNRVLQVSGPGFSPNHLVNP